MKKYIQIITVSFVILFLELLLIRLIGTEIRIFAYFSNLLLLGIFIGSGIGMLIKKRIPIAVSAILLFLTSILVVSGSLAGVTDQLAPLSESFFWFQSSLSSVWGVISGLFLTLLLFLLILGIFIPLGQNLGTLLDNDKQLILVYSLNIIASLAGMWFFQAISIWQLSLYIGIAFAQLLLIFLVNNSWQKLIVFSCFLFSLVIIFFNFLSIENPTIWSPYQKLTLIPQPVTELKQQEYLLQVNNVGYMGLLDLSDNYKNNLKEKLQQLGAVDSVNWQFSDQYSLPFVFKPDSQDVLIVGAGGGNDVAAAVRHGVKNIEAVEIDPKIIAFGKQYHPERPYDSPTVKVYNDDGRSFFKRTQTKYDIVIMGLADSHTLTSSLTNVRLDHYLYTQESFQEIKNILKPGGLIFLTFDVRQDWIGARIKKNLVSTFKTEPLIFSMQDVNYFGWGGVVFVASPDPSAIDNFLSTRTDFKNFVSNRRLDFNNDINPLTDNWPYLYLDEPRLPRIHLGISLFLIILLLLFKRLTPWQGRFQWDFFFLGAGFLLFEFQNISKTSLLFGNTWITNLFTISFILLFILLANFIHAKKKISLRIAYIGLALALVSQFMVPLAALNSLSFYNKLIWGSLFLNLPFFFSGLVFIIKLKEVKLKSVAFASNLIGSAIGGILEIFSFLLGNNAMLIFSLVLYSLSLAPFNYLKNKFFLKL
ncbi:MAG: methyltransferase domain-containing protein [Patescibacteria group bacterium]